MIAANQRRLQRLERYNLVAALPDGTWRVPHDLVESLRSRERTHPGFRLKVEQLVLEIGRRRDRGPALSADSPYLTTAEAQRYLGYRTPGGIRMAVYRGWLRPVGRGPRRTWLFTREAIHAFVTLRSRASVASGCRPVRDET